MPSRRSSRRRESPHNPAPMGPGAPEEVRQLVATPHWGQAKGRAEYDGENRRGQREDAGRVRELDPSRPLRSFTSIDLSNERGVTRPEFRESRKAEVRRILLPRTPVNKPA